MLAMRRWLKVLVVTVAILNEGLAQSPTVTIQSPVSGATVGGSQVEVTVSFSTTSGGVNSLQLFVDSDQGTPAATKTFSPPVQQGTHTFIWDSTTVSNGTHTLIVKAYSGYYYGSVGTAQVSVQVNNPPPTVVIQNPSDGQQIQGVATFEVTGQFSATSPCDRPIKEVRLKIDGNLFAQQTIDPPLTQGTFSFTIPMYRYKNGQHTLTVEVKDTRQTYYYYGGPEGGMDPSVGQASVTVTFFTPPPQVSFVGLSNGQTFSGKSTVKAQFQKVAPNPGGIRVVQLFVDGQLHDERRTEWQQEEMPGEGEVELTLDCGLLSEGLHTLTLKAKDVYGHVGESEPLNVQVVRKNPLVQIVQPAPNSKVGGNQVVTVVRFKSQEGLPITRVRLVLDYGSSPGPGAPPLGYFITQKEFWISDTVKTGPTEGEVKFIWDATPFSNGQHTLTAFVEEYRPTNSSSGQSPPPGYYYGYYYGTPSEPVPIIIDNSSSYPSAPSLKVIQVGADFAVLEWDAVEGNEFAKYEVHVSQGSGFNPNEGTLKATITNRYQVRFKVSSLQPSSNYYAKLRVYNLQGVYNDSNEVRITTLSVDSLFSDNPLPEGTEVVLEKRIYDDAGNLVAVFDANGNGTLYEYDAAGRLIKVTDSLGNKTEFLYDAEGRKIAEINPLNVKDEFIYDASGRLIEQRRGSNTQTPSVTKYGYDAAGRMTSITDPTNSTTQHVYDSKGRLIKVIDPLGNATQYVYDAAGNKIKEITPTGKVTEFYYDANNRLVKIVVDPQNLNLITTYQYDEVGNKISETDPKGRTTKYVYDERNRLIKVIDPQNGESKPTIYEYDAMGNKVKVIDPEGRTVQYGYDALGRLTRLVRGDGTEERYAYDLVGNMIAKKKADGTVIRYEYDAANRLVRRVYPRGKIHQFVYDALGRRVQMTDDVGTVSWQYDELGRVIAVTQPVGSQSKTITYAYDAVGRRMRMTDSEGLVTSYSYDAAGRLVQVSNGLIGTTKFFYDADGRLIRQENGNGTYVTFSYDSAGRLVQIENRRVSGNSLISRFVYDYDAAGNRVKVQEEVLQPDGSWAQAIVSYGYDAIDRLVSEKRVGSNSYWYEYTYDGSGNRLTMVQRDVSGNVIGQKVYSYDGGNKLTQEVANGTTTSYSYDANGNLTAKTTGTSTVRYYWDDEDKMTRLEDSVVMNFKTDGLGFRRYKEVVGRSQTWFVYDLAIGGSPGLSPLIAEYNGNGTLVAKYHHKGDLLAMTRENQSYWYAVDGIGGSVRQLINNTQNIASYYAFDAWGGILGTSSSSVSNPFQYVGSLWYYHDHQSNQYLLGVRYYHASLGRFVSRDPSRRDWHDYVYARSRGVNMVDPTGEIADWIFCLLPCGCAAGMPLAALLGCISGGCRETGTCWDCMRDTICEFKWLWAVCLGGCIACLLHHPHPPHEPPCPPDKCPNGNCPPEPPSDGKRECPPWKPPPGPDPCEEQANDCRLRCSHLCLGQPRANYLRCIFCCWDEEEFCNKVGPGFRFLCAEIHCGAPLPWPPPLP